MKAASASVPDRPWTASRISSLSSAMARLATRCWTSARLSTCLYSEGGLTPSRSASRPMVTPPIPISSASPAAAAVTSWLFSPALGTRVLLQEGQDQRGRLVRALRVHVVPAAVDHGRGGPPGRHGRHYRLGLGPRGGEVGGPR